MCVHPLSGDMWVSVLGYVIDASTNPMVGWFEFHPGRDITTRNLMHFHDIPLDKNDDRQVFLENRFCITLLRTFSTTASFVCRGLPPYPLVSELTTDELDHITNWLDIYHIRKNLTLYPIVGYLKEFLDQQKSGVSTFTLPPRI